MAVSRTTAAENKALQLRGNLLPVMFLTSVTLLSHKLQTILDLRHIPKHSHLADSSYAPESGDWPCTRSSSLA